MTTRSKILATALVTAGLFILPGPNDGSVMITWAAAQNAPTALSEAQDVNGVVGVIAEIVQSKRDGGVLSVRMRLRNTGSSDARVDVIMRGNYDQYYVTAGNKKYFVLRDSEKTPLANPINDGFNNALRVEIPKGGTFTWFAKYPAPPVEVKKINYYTPITTPFEDVPVSD